jgi:hypothetical protein
MRVKDNIIELCNFTTCDCLLNLNSINIIISFQEVENNIHNLVCAGTLFCTQFGGGLVCLLRLETHPGANMMRSGSSFVFVLDFDLFFSLVLLIFVFPTTVTTVVVGYCLFFLDSQSSHRMRK